MELHSQWKTDNIKMINKKIVCVCVCDKCYKIKKHEQDAGVEVIKAICERVSQANICEME